MSPQEDSICVKTLIALIAHVGAWAGYNTGHPLIRETSNRNRKNSCISKDFIPLELSPVVHESSAKSGAGRQWMRKIRNIHQNWQSGPRPLHPSPHIHTTNVQISNQHPTIACLFVAKQGVSKYMVPQICTYSLTKHFLRLRYRSNKEVELDPRGMEKAAMFHESAARCWPHNQGEQDRCLVNSTR